MSSGRGNAGKSHQQGRQYQGRGKTRNDKSTSSKPTFKPTKKTLNDNIYYLGSAKQAADYERTTKFLINIICKSFVMGNDVAIALEQLQPYNLDPYKPTLQRSSNGDPIIAENEDAQYKIDFKAEYDGYIHCKQALEANISNAYAFLWEQCHIAMQQKVEVRSDYEALIKGDPNDLL
jgi:hypothetical protein